MEGWREEGEEEEAAATIQFGIVRSDSLETGISPTRPWPAALSRKSFAGDFPSLGLQKRPHWPFLLGQPKRAGPRPALELLLTSRTP